MIDLPGGDIYRDPIVTEAEEQAEAEEFWLEHERDFGPYREMLAARAQPIVEAAEHVEEWTNF